MIKTNFISYVVLRPRTVVTFASLNLRTLNSFAHLPTKVRIATLMTSKIVLRTTSSRDSMSKTYWLLRSRQHINHTPFCRRSTFTSIKQRRIIAIIHGRLTRRIARYQLLHNLRRSCTLHTGHVDGEHTKLIGYTGSGWEFIEQKEVSGRRCAVQQG